MRNWNYSDASKTSLCLSGFQTTYEELKPNRDAGANSSNYGLPDYLWGIETRARTKVDIRRGHRFQTTYEELKPFQHDSHLQCGVFSLPDYLWGIETLKIDKEKAAIVQLPDYLWGIETLKIDKEKAAIVQLPDYLWGIETWLVLDWRVLGYKASRLPMRNWNRRQSWKKIICRGLPDYLWGIETLRFQNISIHIPASRLPMRNWNTTAPSMSVSSYSLPDYLWGIETWNWTWESTPCRGFQTTYEELKPDKMSGLNEKLKAASRLPMRNWNRWFLLRDPLEPQLPDYLWGIETIPRLIGLMKMERLPDYLWGIETVEPGIKGEEIKGFQTTYEELKPMILGKLDEIKASFQTTYEELKPLPGCRTSLRSKGFQTTYEELKPSYPRRL